MPKDCVFCRCYVILMVALDTSYLSMYWADLHVFKMGWHDQYDLIFAIAQGTLLW